MPTIKRATKKTARPRSQQRRVRHPAAVARDKWLASEAGQRCCNGTTYGQYLQNRLVEAFLAGWEAAEKQQTCFRCGGKPVRGGDRQGSALCQSCYDYD